MPTGPNGERRPANTIEAAIQVARIAVGDIEEDYGKKPETKSAQTKKSKKQAQNKSNKAKAYDTNHSARHDE